MYYVLGIAYCALYTQYVKSVIPIRGSSAAPIYPSTASVDNALNPRYGPIYRYINQSINQILPSLRFPLSGYQAECLQN